MQSLITFSFGDTEKQLKQSQTSMIFSKIHSGIANVQGDWRRIIMILPLRRREGKDWGIRDSLNLNPGRILEHITEQFISTLGIIR